MTTPKPATDTIVRQQEEVKRSLPFDDTQDFEDASRGFIGTTDSNIVTNASGRRVWDNHVYAFLKEGAPNEANPSLWRQSQLAAKDGLFEVTEGIYQVRGFDISNVTFIEGNEGVIVIDPLTSSETAAAAFQLYQDHRGPRPVKAVIYTHSHIDHFGGVKGMVTQDDVDAGKVAILAPEGFLEHAVAENVFAGTAMGRRAAYMYGAGIARGPKSQIGCGLGQAVSTGTFTLIAPTDTITTTGETRTIDGVPMEFQMAPDTEAPSEMLIYFPAHKALCAAEDATHTFHNILTLRGAVIRDPHGWAKYLTETIDLFASRTDVLFVSHHWPIWGGAARIRPFLTQQRDLYAYVHDQTLRQLNQGLTGPEIAETFTLPPGLEQAWNTRGYYGSLSHNVKAVYQRYMGWFDGNPSQLWLHPPVARAQRYVALLGGTAAVTSAAQAAFNEGDFRWAAELLNHAVFASPSSPNNDNNDAARALLADTYEQLGYGAENGPWRNFYLSGAKELRDGGKTFGTPTPTGSTDIVAQLTPEMVFDALAVQVDGPRAAGEDTRVDVVVTDLEGDKGGERRYRVWLSNGALVYSRREQPGQAQVTVTGTARVLTALTVYRLDPGKFCLLYTSPSPRDS